MSRTDLISDSLTMIRNAIMAKKENLDIPGSTMMGSILDVLKKEGYIDNYKKLEDKKQGLLRVYLKYVGSKSAIRTLKKVSRPGLKIYVKKEKIPRVLRGRGVAIISTSKGILTDKEAREANLGGEIIAYVW